MISNDSPDQFSDIASAHHPTLGSAAGWPLVLYFHHVHPEISHYTALGEKEFESGLRLLLEYFAAYDPAQLLSAPEVDPPSDPSVLITFDDGYRDNFDRARTLLDRCGIRAVFFVITDRMGERSADPRQDHMSWEQCDALAAEGHVIAAHSASHTRLDLLPEDQARREVASSLARVQERYGHRRRLFAYPYGMVPHSNVVPDDTIAFGTVRSRPQPWAACPQSIRRTYLPVQHPLEWEVLVENWSQQWHRVSR
ncbi:polysaccharide deacetylase family protein [Streptomyces decoyicus]|uniref:Polysaccharide deacetylase family protein n=1 Tax=Streptomyces decoyicus TaxID=249567 RepID=A0ABZ1FCZ5_9ACTN|nr:polysaccharide deacetylase family protein [Streptomyces decoyicus]WSB68249.1 polysaccharide deacetylase family protein [Streptomyces decoyicus]